MTKLAGLFCEAAGAGAPPGNGVLAAGTERENVAAAVVAVQG